MAKGLMTNEELVDSIISDLNMLVKNITGGEYIQFCARITGITQKLLNLKTGIKSDMDNKIRIIETLKDHIRNLGEEVKDMSIEEYLQNHAIKKDGVTDGNN